MPPKKKQQDGGAAKAARTEETEKPESKHDVNPHDRATNQLGADDKYKTGPFSLLYQAVHTPSNRVLILMRNQKRLVSRVRAFDRHFNMLLVDTQELSNETDASGHPKTRHIPKMFLRGDTIISVVSVKGQQE